MKTAVVQAYEVLNNSMKEIDFYTNSIPDSDLTKPNLPLGRIVELQGQYTNSVSNTPQAITFYIQVDIWVDTLEEVSEYYFKVDEIMRTNGWDCTYTEQTDDKDLPDSKRIIKRYFGTINIEF